MAMLQHGGTGRAYNVGTPRSAQWKGFNNALPTGIQPLKCHYRGSFARWVVQPHTKPPHMCAALTDNKLLEMARRLSGSPLTSETSVSSRIAEAMVKNDVVIIEGGRGTCEELCVPLYTIDYHRALKKEIQKGTVSMKEDDVRLCLKFVQAINSGTAVGQRQAVYKDEPEVPVNITLRPADDDPVMDLRHAGMTTMPGVKNKPLTTASSTSKGTTTEVGNKIFGYVCRYEGLESVLSRGTIGALFLEDADMRDRHAQTAVAAAVAALKGVGGDCSTETNGRKRRRLGKLVLFKKCRSTDISYFTKYFELHDLDVATIGVSNRNEGESVKLTTELNMLLGVKDVPLSKAAFEGLKFAKTEDVLGRVNGRTHTKAATNEQLRQLERMPSGSPNLSYCVPEMDFTVMEAVTTCVEGLKFEDRKKRTYQRLNPGALPTLVAIVRSQSHVNMLKARVTDWPQLFLVSMRGENGQLIYRTMDGGKTAAPCKTRTMDSITAQLFHGTRIPRAEECGSDAYVNPGINVDRNVFPCEDSSTYKQGRLIIGTADSLRGVTPPNTTCIIDCCIALRAGRYKRNGLMSMSASFTNRADVEANQKIFGNFCSGTYLMAVGDYTASQIMQPPDQRAMMALISDSYNLNTLLLSLNSEMCDVPIAIPIPPHVREEMEKEAYYSGYVKLMKGVSGSTSYELDSHAEYALKIFPGMHPSIALTALTMMKTGLFAHGICYAALSETNYRIFNGLSTDVEELANEPMKCTLDIFDKVMQHQMNMGAYRNDIAAATDLAVSFLMGTKFTFARSRDHGSFQDCLREQLFGRQAIVMLGEKNYWRGDWAASANEWAAGLLEPIPRADRNGNGSISCDKLVSRQTIQNGRESFEASVVSILQRLVNTGVIADIRMSRAKCFYDSGLNKYTDHAGGNTLTANGRHLFEAIHAMFSTRLCLIDSSALSSHNQSKRTNIKGKVLNAQTNASTTLVTSPARRQVGENDTWLSFCHTTKCLPEKDEYTALTAQLTDFQVAAFCNAIGRWGSDNHTKSGDNMLRLYLNAGPGEDFVDLMFEDKNSSFAHIVRLREAWRAIVMKCLDGNGGEYAQDIINAWKWR